MGESEESLVIVSWKRVDPQVNLCPYPYAAMVFEQVPSSALWQEPRLWPSSWAKVPPPVAVRRTNENPAPQKGREEGR